VRRARAIAHKELIHIVRDARTLYLALGLPVVMLVLFGYAVSLDVDHVPLAVVDEDHTRASREVAESLVAGGAFTRVATSDTAEDAQTLMRRGRIKAALVVPRGYQRHLARGEPTGAQLLVDGSDGTTATIAVGDAAGIIQARAAARRAPTHASVLGGPAIRARFNPGMRSSFVIVPGVIAMILAMVSALLSALAIAREWERGSMEQLFATPVGRAEIILGKLLPYAAVGLVQTLLVLTLGSIMFDVPLRGSLPQLFGASLLFLVSMLGLGLLLSVVTKSQIVSVQFALIGSMMPSLLLSGFLFPIQNMPWWLQGISAAVPARYYVTALRGVMLKGNGLETLGPAVLALAGFAAAVLGLAVVRFHRRLS
jgi:ABC-2 type transport system permease protein